MGASSGRHNGPQGHTRAGAARRSRRALLLAPVLKDDVSEAWVDGGNDVQVIRQPQLHVLVVNVLQVCESGGGRRARPAGLPSRGGGELPGAFQAAAAVPQLLQSA